MANIFVKIIAKICLYNILLQCNYAEFYINITAQYFTSLLLRNVFYQNDYTQLHANTIIKYLYECKIIDVNTAKIFKLNMNNMIVVNIDLIMTLK